MEHKKAIELLEETRTRMHRFIDEQYDELLDRLTSGEGISVKPRELPLKAYPPLFRGEKPELLTFPDGQTIPTPTWKSVAWAVLKACNDKPEMHQRLMNIRGSVAGRTRFILSDSPSEMNVPLKIDEELYFEGKFDSEYLMKMLTKRVLDRIGYDYSGIVVTLRPSDYIGAAETDEPAEIADEDEAEGFGMQLL